MSELLWAAFVGAATGNAIHAAIGAWLTDGREAVMRAQLCVVSVLVAVLGAVQL
jgi:hypothetical protein